MLATREDLFANLDELGIVTETVEHPPLFSVEESRALRSAIAGAHTKNLLVKCKKGTLWLIVALESTFVDLKGLAKRLGCGRFSFAREDLLRGVMGVEAGSVTPFALINTAYDRLNVVIDEDLMAHERLNFHPLENTATTTIPRDGLLLFISACGHKPVIVNLGARARGEANR